MPRCALQFLELAATALAICRQHCITESAVPAVQGLGQNSILISGFPHMHGGLALL